jgi:hypothetical protein
MPSFGMLHHVDLVRTNIFEEHIASIDKNRRASLLVTANIVPSSLILVTQIMEVIHSSETSVLTKATLCKIPEDGILQNRTELVKKVRERERDTESKDEDN